jgi:hypothetical protein
MLLHRLAQASVRALLSRVVERFAGGDPQPQPRVAGTAAGRVTTG